MPSVLAFVRVGLIATAYGCAAHAPGPVAVSDPTGDVVTVTTVAELQAALAAPGPGAVVRLAPGTYHLEPRSGTDPTCGNCQDVHKTVPMTYGLRISGRGVRVLGPERGTAEIVTNAGYGLYFVDCQKCILERVAVTGGARDPDAEATDAAVVVRNSTVTLRENHLHDNIGSPELIEKHIVGIAGVIGREGADIELTGNRITRNSWDGVALYRGARARITGNVIDGVDKAPGRQAGGGRGVAIGVTWDAEAVIEHNLVTRYWKGIGVFLDARAEVRGNLVEDILTWGIAYWDADKGRPAGFFAENAVHNTGACGVSIQGPTEGLDVPGYFAGNAVVKTGQNPKYDDPDYYCRQTALALHNVPRGFVIADNAFFQNRRAGDDLPDPDLPEDAFRRAVRPLCHALREVPRFATSGFATGYCAPSDKPETAQEPAPGPT